MSDLPTKEVLAPWRPIQIVGVLIASAIVLGLVVLQHAPNPATRVLEPIYQKF